MIKAKSRIQEMRTTVYNKKMEKKEYFKKAIFIPKIFDVFVGLEKGDEIEQRLSVLDDKEWKLEITGKMKKRPKFLLGT